MQSSQAQREKATLGGGVLELPIPDSDAGLVAALRSGRQTAKAALFDRYGRHVERVLTRVLGPDPDIPDLLQDVFVSALVVLAAVALITARGAKRTKPPEKPSVRVPLTQATPSRVASQ